MHDIYIIGVGGLATEVEWLIHRINLQEPTFRIAAFVVGGDSPALGTIHGAPIISEGTFQESIMASPSLQFNIVIAVGNPRLRRQIIHRQLRYPNLHFPSLVDPNAIVGNIGDYVKVGRGVLIRASAIVTSGVTMGNFVHIYLGSTISHNVSIGNYATISPGAHIAGNVTIQDGVFIGMGAVIIEDLLVGQGATVGAGAVVIHDVVPNTTVVGVPAKPKNHVSPDWGAMLTPPKVDVGFEKIT